MRVAIYARYSSENQSEKSIDDQIREVYKAAILANAASVCFLHNHPSGSTEPSIDDIEITNRLCKAGSILGINVLDHLIITTGGYLSFKQKGLI